MMSAFEQAASGQKRPVADLRLDELARTCSPCRMATARRDDDATQRVLLCVSGLLVAAVFVSLTLRLPGMMALSPDVTGLVATAAMGLTIRRGLIRRNYVSAWLAVVATPILAVCGFAATYLWWFL